MLNSVLRRYVSGALLVLGVTALLVLLRETLTIANFASVYLLTVLVAAMFLGTGPSLVAVLVSFLCLNFFLIKPYYTLSVADPRDVLDLFIFLIVAALAGQLAAHANRQTSDARRRAHEQDILYELTSTFNQLTDRPKVYETLSKFLEQDLAARQSEIVQSNQGDALERSADLNTLLLPLRAGERNYGALRISFEKPPTPSQLRLVTACAVQMSMALQRIELAQRAQQSKTFEEADRLKTALLHAVSHDLRTPITIIKTSASNLLNLHATLPEDERIETIRAIENEADQLNKMVGNLLDLSRLKAGALQINSQWNSLEEVAGDVAARVWQLTHQERIKLVFPDELPLVRFDHGLILEALTNLVENSLRYAPAGSQVEIIANVRENCGRPAEVRLSVVNHGPNVSLQEREGMFEPFHPGKGGNIGLGLAIARGILEAHQGRLWLEDTPGGGATFVFSLPVDGTTLRGNYESDEDPGRR